MAGLLGVLPACVVDRDGQLAIAKFPQHGEGTRITLWEAVALSLAAKAGIPTPEWRIKNVADRDVLLLRRFDRCGHARSALKQPVKALWSMD
jgi:serine/threonine-protein kinase HipA